MGNKKSIGIVTWYKGGNYGTTLQAFALYTFLKIAGYNCSIIENFNYKLFGGKSFLKSLIRPTHFFEIRNRQRLNKKKNVLKLLKINDFIKKYMKVVLVENRIQYNSLIRKTDVFCVGSDQLWNAYYMYNPFNFLDFAGEKKRISYAASMGTNDFPESYENSIKQLLIKFKHIAMRENTGTIAVSKLTDRDDIKTVVDPTFLLTKEEWQYVGSSPSFEIDMPSKYILCYFIGNNANYGEQVEILKKKTRISNVIDISIVDSPVYSFSGSVKYDTAGIIEFLYLLSHATWVCTDSFHATAISINMGKNFTEFLRFKDGDKASQNSRIYDVLDTFKLSERLYSDESDNWAKPIDYTVAHNILDALRKDSSEWLINAIEH